MNSTAAAAPQKRNSESRCDPARIARQRSLHARYAPLAADYAQQAVLSREVATRLLECLDYVRQVPQRVLDLGCGPLPMQALLQRYPAAECYACDVVPPSAVLPSAALVAEKSSGPALLAADATALPFAAGSLDLICTNLMLHALADGQGSRSSATLSVCLQQMRDALSPSGLLLFSGLGPDTARELRTPPEDRTADPLPDYRPSTLMDMHTIGDLLLECGLVGPVMEMEQITLTYPRAEPLIWDLRACGLNAVWDTLDAAALSASSSRLTQQMQAVWAEPWSRGEPVSITFELIYGHAWKTQSTAAAESAAPGAPQTIRWM